MGEVDLRTERGRWALETAQQLITARLGGKAYEETFNREVKTTTLDDLLHLIDALVVIAEFLAVAGSDAPLDVAKEQGRSKEEIEELLEVRSLVYRSPQSLLAFVDERVGVLLGHRGPNEDVNATN